MTWKKLALLLCAAVVMFALGCGDNNNSKTNNQPGIAGSGNGSGSGGSGSPSTAPDTYTAQFFLTVGRTPMPPIGSVTLDSTANDGSGTVNMTSGGPNQTYSIQFCGFPNQFKDCTNVTAVSTDANGAGSATFKFPASGTVSGVFVVAPEAQQYGAGVGIGSAVNFQSALLPANTVTAGIASNTTTPNVTGSGTATVNGTMAHIALQGALASQSFQVNLCDMFNNCNSLGTLATDGSGNGSVDVSVANFPNYMGVFALKASDGSIAYVSAFRVQ